LVARANFGAQRFSAAESTGKYHVTTKRTKDTKDLKIVLRIF
jgi:hypothetical protein